MALVSTLLLLASTAGTASHVTGARPSRSLAGDLYEQSTFVANIFKHGLVRAMHGRSLQSTSVLDSMGGAAGVMAMHAASCSTAQTKAVATQQLKAAMLSAAEQMQPSVAEAIPAAQIVECVCNLNPLSFLPLADLKSTSPDFMASLAAVLPPIMSSNNLCSPACKAALAAVVRVIPDVVATDDLAETKGWWLDAFRGPNALMVRELVSLADSVPGCLCQMDLPAMLSAAAPIYADSIGGRRHLVEGGGALLSSASPEESNEEERVANTLFTALIPLLQGGRGLCASNCRPLLALFASGFFSFSYRVLRHEQGNDAQHQDYVVGADGVDVVVGVDAAAFAAVQPLMEPCMCDAGFDAQKVVTTIVNADWDDEQEKKESYRSIFRPFCGLPVCNTLMSTESALLMMAAVNDEAASCRHDTASACLARCMPCQDHDAITQPTDATGRPCTEYCLGSTCTGAGHHFVAEFWSNCDSMNDVCGRTSNLAEGVARAAGNVTGPFIGTGTGTGPSPIASAGAAGLTILLVAVLVGVGGGAAYYFLTNGAGTPTASRRSTELANPTASPNLAGSYNLELNPAAQQARAGEQQA